MGLEVRKIKNRFKVADFIVPSVSGMIFLLVLFFILIPSIESSSDMLMEIEKIEARQVVLRRNLDIVETINFTELQKDLSNARKVLPNRLEVAQFAYYIDSLAQEKDLEFRELKATDVASNTEETSVLNIKGIRVPMGYGGDYEPILDFFDELQLASPYVISFGHKVELNKSGSKVDGDINWSLEIDVTGYYVEEEGDLVSRVNYTMVPIVPYNSREDMIAKFTERVQKLAN